MMLVRNNTSEPCVPTSQAEKPMQDDPKSENHQVLLEGLARDLANIAASHHLSDSLVSLGFLNPIVKMLGPDNACSETSQAFACRALAHLASRREYVKQIHDAAPLPGLLQHLQSGSTSLALSALEALRPLSRDASFKSALRDSGGVGSLLELIGVAATQQASSQDLAVAEAALSVLRNLSACTSNQDPLRNAVCIRVLATLLATLSPEVRPCATARAASTLANLAVANQTNKNEIRKVGCIPSLCAMLTASDGDVRSAATEALGNLAVKSAPNKDAIRDAGGVRTLAGMYRAATGCGPERGRGIDRSRGGSRQTSPASSSPSSSHPPSRCPSRGSSPSSRPSTCPSSRPSSCQVTPRTSRDPSPNADDTSPEPSFASRAPKSVARAEREPSSKLLSAASAPPLLLPSSTSVGKSAHDAANAVLTPLVTPPDTARQSGTDGVGPSVERIHWALRNLILANGLNSAVLVASGVPLSEVENAPAKALPITQETPNVPAAPPSLPPALVRQGTQGSETEAFLPIPKSMGKAPAGLGLTMWSKTGRAC